jgi:hypothetical protein
MTYWLAPLILRLGTNQHLAHPGDIVFRHACAMGLVSKRLGALHFRELEGLAQVQESERAGREAGGEARAHDAQAVADAGTDLTVESPIRSQRLTGCKIVPLPPD